MRTVLAVAICVLSTSQLACVAALAGGAALGSQRADSDARRHVDVQLVSNIDGRPVCRVQCARSPRFCYDTVASICKRWMGDEEPVVVNPSPFSLNSSFEMRVVCADPVRTEDVCQ